MHLWHGTWNERIAEVLTRGLRILEHVSGWVGTAVYLASEQGKYTFTRKP
jgi:hypothetical protein